MLLLGSRVASLGRLWSSKALLKEGLLWWVGNGRKISIWDDPWLLDEDGRNITTAKNDEVHMLHELIDEDNMGWKIDVIEGMFNERDQRWILPLSLSDEFSEDEMTWDFSKDGLYLWKLHVFWVKVATTLINFIKNGLIFGALKLVLMYVIFMEIVHNLSPYSLFAKLPPFHRWWYLHNKNPPF